MATTPHYEYIRRLLNDYAERNLPITLYLKGIREPLQCVVRQIRDVAGVWTAHQIEANNGQPNEGFTVISKERWQIFALEVAAVREQFSEGTERFDLDEKNPGSRSQHYKRLGPPLKHFPDEGT